MLYCIGYGSVIVHPVIYMITPPVATNVGCRMSIGRISYILCTAWHGLACLLYLHSTILHYSILSYPIPTYPILQYCTQYCRRYLAELSEESTVESTAQIRTIA
jgi:hypothetical protein